MWVAYISEFYKKVLKLFFLTINLMDEYRLHPVAQKGRTLEFVSITIV